MPFEQQESQDKEEQNDGLDWKWTLENFDLIFGTVFAPVIFFLPPKPHMYIWLKTVLSSQNIQTMSIFTPCFMTTTDLLGARRSCGQLNE